MIGWRTSDNPAPSDNQKKGNTASKLHLNGVKIVVTGFLLPAPLRPRQETFFKRKLSVRVMCVSERTTCAMDLFFVHFERHTKGGSSAGNITQLAQDHVTHGTRDGMRLTVVCGASFE